MPPYQEQAIVLRTYKLGEADRICHLLSTGRGKIRAVAKGVRRPGSRFGARLEPCSLVDLQLHTGKSFDVISQAELLSSFADVRADWVRSACAQTMVESADRVAQEGERNVSLLLLLRDALVALDHDPAEPAAVLDAYLLRLASVAGYHPTLTACAACGAPGDHAAFNLDAGGSLCPACAPAGSPPLSDGVLGVLRRLADEPWERLGGGVDAPGAARRSAAALIASYLAHHLGGPLRAWELVPR
jgi:DNA repair protein RecO (recombination protein O)